MLDKTANSVTYRGGEEQSVFPIPFPFLENSHIRAWVRRGDGAGAALVAGTDYAINNVSEGNGELILLGEPLPEGAVLTISRLVPLTQEILFHNQGPNSPRAMEEAADKLTMIAQQLQAGLDNCVAAPDGAAPEEIAEAITGGIAAVAELRAEVVALDAKADGKAARVHNHALSEVTDLESRLSAKADAAHRHTQSEIDGLLATLSAKAESGQVLGKADREHVHAQSDVSGLADALAGKLDADDPRLATLGQIGSHAASHAAAGDDPIRPADIGVLPAPPSDGKTYLAVGGGWVEYVAPSGGGGGGEGGTLDHSQLLNRDAAGQHPQSAIRNLSTDLDGMRAAIDALGSSLDGVNGVPSGGTAGDILAAGAGGTPEWKSPPEAAALLPLMTPAQKGVARLAADAGLELDAGGALRIAADSLVSKTNLEGRFSALDGRLASLSDLGDRIASVETSVQGANDALNGLGAMAAVDDAPRNGKSHVRQDGAWLEFSGSGGSSGGGAGAIVGEIRLLPFRREELPAGWYFANGDCFSLTSAQGLALAGLSENMKGDWGIAEADGAISLPNLLAADGCFLRPVDNSARRPGSVQGDAIRNITGVFSLSGMGGIAWTTSTYGTSTANGAFAIGPGSKLQSFVPQSHGMNNVTDLLFDASGSVPTADENRPVNIGMTPAIYLGV